MAGPSLLVFIRHAESLMNVIKGDGPFIPESDRATVQGMWDLDVPLTEHGKSQARREGTKLRARFGSFNVVYHSAARRARETAENASLTFSHSPPFTESFLLNERDSGYTFGMTREDSAHHFPWLEPHWARAGWFYARPPGGESVCDVATNRVLPFMNQLARQHDGQRILVVGHGRWIQAARIIIESLSIEPEVPHGRNCGWLVYRRDWNTKQLVLQEENNYFNAP